MKLKDAAKPPDNLKNMQVVPAPPSAPLLPPIVIESGLKPGAVGPTPEVLTSPYERLKQWISPASQFRIPPLPAKSNTQQNAAIQSISRGITEVIVEPVQSQVTSLAQQFQNTGFQGAWSSTIFYPVDAQVTFGGEYWVCILGNLNQTPSSGSSYWQQLSGTNPYLGVWSSATTYATGDQVSYQGNFYIAIAPSTNQTPVTTSSAFWTLLGTSVILIGSWSSGVAYVQGNQVTFSGNVYQCILANTNQTPPNATYWTLIGPATLDDLADGASHFSATGSTLTYRPTTNPLTAVDAGSNATINIASFTMLTSSKGSVSINSGSITGLSYSTQYFVYYDDSTLAGGSVTFNATTTKTTAINGAGRFFVGSITTPPSGGSATTGNNDGGVGAQAGQFLKIFFSTAANIGISTSNLVNVNDGNDSTFAKISIFHPGSNTLNQTITVSLPISAVYSFESAVLKVKSAIPTAVQGGGALTLTCQYSLDGGQTFTQIYSQNTTRALTIDGITLTSPINTSRIQVQFIASLTITPTGSCELDAYEAWLEITQ